MRQAAILVRQTKLWRRNNNHFWKTDKIASSHVASRGIRGDHRYKMNNNLILKTNPFFTTMNFLTTIDKKKLRVMYFVVSSELSLFFDDYCPFDMRYEINESGYVYNVHVCLCGKMRNYSLCIRFSVVISSITHGGMGFWGMHEWCDWMENKERLFVWRKWHTYIWINRAI